MIAQGRIENGVVVLTGGVRLPEGQIVTVLAAPPPASNGHGIADIPSVSLGSFLRPSTSVADLLDEMLEGR
jgi:hypothetical protein